MQQQPPPMQDPWRQQQQQPPPPPLARDPLQQGLPPRDPLQQAPPPRDPLQSYASPLPQQPPARDPLQQQPLRDPLARDPLQPTLPSQQQSGGCLPQHGVQSTCGARGPDPLSQSEQDMGLLQQLLVQPDQAPLPLGRVRLGGGGVWQGPPGSAPPPLRDPLSPGRTNTQVPLDQLLLQQQIVEQQRSFHELEMARLQEQQAWRQSHLQEWAQRVHPNTMNLASDVDSYIAQKDDYALAKIMSLGFDVVGPSLAASTAISASRKLKFAHRPRSAGSRPQLRLPASKGPPKPRNQSWRVSAVVCVEVRRKEDLLRLSKAISPDDDTLTKDMDVSKVRLARGLKLLREGPLKGCKSICAALATIQPWATLTFERPTESKPRTLLPNRMCVEVMRTEELQALARAVSSTDHTLQHDLELGGVRLGRGFRLLLDGPLKGSAFLHEALSRLQPRAVLTFEKPGGSRGGGQAANDFCSHPWSCPLCNSWYPVRVPGDLMASNLLQDLLPEGSFILEPEFSDLWVKSELDRQPRLHARGAESLEALDVTMQDDQGHILQLYSAPRDLFPCTVCSAEMSTGTSMYGCTECFFFMCMACVSRVHKSRGRADDAENIVPLPSAEEQKNIEEEASAQKRLGLLVRFATHQFDLAPILHFGRIRRLVTDAPEVARFCQRDMAGLLLPLADPYDYYVRAAILHSLVPICKTDEHRDQVLHEAHESLLQALHGTHVGPSSTTGALAKQQFAYLQARNPLASRTESWLHEDRASSDPRIWFLLGVVLCDMGALADARLCYRKVLERLPMACFRHVVHFNLAVLQAGFPGESSKNAALRELKEFRRCCQSLQGMPFDGANQAADARCSSRCDLCGARL